jgi:ABC-type sulfate/molybdate transport systems ATPase subunit
MTSSAATASSVLELQGLHKTYRLGEHIVPALQGVDLQLRASEMLALTGPSGSGKSTLLNLAGLIDRADAGRILFCNRDVTRLDETDATLLRRDAIGFIFQGFNLVPVMTVADNVDYPLFSPACRPPSAASGWRPCCRRWAWPPMPRTGRTPCPAASASAWPSPGRWSNGQPW